MSWRVICADVLDGLAQLEDESIQCVVTSPPYWGLRDYGTAAWDGGDADCDHVREGKERKFTNGRGEGVDDNYAGSNLRSWTTRDAVPSRACGKCGARRIDQQLGLEPTPEAYVERMVEVFREVRRVLRSDGTVWLNLGDSYAGSFAQTLNEKALKGKQGTNKDTHGIAGIRDVPNGLKPKDLVGIPWRVAFALQADGWWLRSDIIWAKPNPMPESVTDRPTKAHEYVFLLTKSARYFYDQDAVREASTELSMHAAEHWKPAEKRNGDGQSSRGPGPLARVGEVGAGRNLRSVWSIATEPFPEAHFATFPKALVVPCIKAGSQSSDALRSAVLDSSVAAGGARANGGLAVGAFDPRCTVLDPFCGSGTTGLVALRHGRSFVGIELSPDYAEMARRRIQNDAPLFNVPEEVTA